MMSNENVLITGGAKGIGKAVASLFASRGANIIIADLDPSAELVADDIRARGGKADFIETDLRKELSVTDLFQSIAGSHGDIRYAINNAGVDLEGSSAEWDYTKFASTVAVNLGGVMMCMEHEIRTMRAAGRGSIVNVSSVAGLAGAPGRPAYVASKHGVIGLTRTAAMQFGPDNIRINAVCPGATRTELFTDAVRHSPAMEDAIASACPLRRIGEPEEIARAILWLASEESSYVTGHALVVDGGFLAG